MLQWVFYLLLALSTMPLEHPLGHPASSPCSVISKEMTLTFSCLLAPPAFTDSDQRISAAVLPASPSVTVWLLPQ